MTGAGRSPSRRSMFDRLFGAFDSTDGDAAASYAEPQPGDFGYVSEC